MNAESSARQPIAAGQHHKTFANASACALAVVYVGGVCRLLQLFVLWFVTFEQIAIRMLGWGH
jgi:hypothetical protein